MYNDTTTLDIGSSHATEQCKIVRSPCQKSPSSKHQVLNDLLTTGLDRPTRQSACLRTSLTVSDMKTEGGSFMSGNVRMQGSHIIKAVDTSMLEKGTHTMLLPIYVKPRQADTYARHC